MNKREIGSNKREIGSRFEAEAAAYLEKKGMILEKRNFRCRQGEIDLIARDGEYLVFVEVKYRSGKRWGRPAEAVTPAKIKKIRETAAYYIHREYGGQEFPCRFDVVEITGDAADGRIFINHMENAF